MGDSYSVKNCTCEVPGAEQEHEHDLCLHYFAELDISSSDPDDLELESDADHHSSIFHDLEKNQNVFTENGFDSDEPISPNPNLTPFSDENSSNISPCAKKLTSAMKGSREKEGKIITKLNVKWAPDVYDPPVTSDDHTMKRVSYKPRVKNSKKEYYYKQQKYTKSKRESSKSERKKSSRSSSSSKINDPRMIRLLAKHGKTLTNNYPNSPPKFEELRGQNKIVSEKKTSEIKFGSSFCRELVGSPLHRSLAEAS